MVRRTLAVVLTLLLSPLLATGSAAAAVRAGPAGVTGVPAAAVGVPAVGPGAPAAPGQPGPPTFRWPLAGNPTVARPFQPPPRPWLPGHRGVDLGGSPGETVFAAGPGVVAFAGSVAGTGVVSIDHPNGLRTTYEPVLPLVHAGQPVVAGQPIGALLPGHPGCPVAACLHWGLRRGTEYLDPLILLRAGRVRLLPLDGTAR
jgi:murein DD-endopeptidase MepM/ murein hydrolase activator NlpD